VDGHIITRDWQQLPCCHALAALLGALPLQMRVFPSLQDVEESISSQVKRQCKVAGFPRDSRETVALTVLTQMRPLLERWADSLPRFLLLRFLRPALRRVHAAGFVFLQVDRNPQRLVAVCRKAWYEMHCSVFLTPRYSVTCLPPCSSSSDWDQRTIDSLQNHLESKGLRMWAFRRPTSSARPRAHFTVKQKSLLSASPPQVRFRPIVAHHLHPLRGVLRRASRALSLLVMGAIEVVQSHQPLHTPMWRLHKGTASWLAVLGRSSAGFSEIAEFDVTDCFLNTTRSAAVPAVAFWMDRLRRRGPLHFSISKDQSDADHLGSSSSPHFWCFSSLELLAVVEWELLHNDLFECVSGVADHPFVLQQIAGLPMGGHLSAALVELVALRRELEQSWPVELSGLPTARYRDNFFVACLPLMLPEILGRGAAMLSELLGMPVKLEGSSQQRRMLEVVLSTGPPAKCVLAFRDAADRQGESWDVTSWPCRADPRLPQLLHSLLSGLAAKIRLYHSAGTPGFSASWRQAYAFVKRRGYPSKRWLRPLAMAALRQGAAVHCLPKVLRCALSAADSGDYQHSALHAREQ
jgi:hypothetical protein